VERTGVVVAVLGKTRTVHAAARPLMAIANGVKTRNQEKPSAFGKLASGDDKVQCEAMQAA
jgi:hypothetical protein